MSMCWYFREIALDRCFTVGCALIVVIACLRKGRIRFIPHDYAMSTIASYSPPQFCVLNDYGFSRVGALLVVSRTLRIFFAV